ncbi:MAG: hypothetical protein ABIU96_14430 [Rhodanobacter sp.]
MNEFEWLRQLRELRQPLPPQRDLWAAISAVVEERGHDDNAASSTATAPAPVSEHAGRVNRWSVACGLVAALLLAGGAGWQLAQPSADVAVAKRTPQQWTPVDPRLRGAAIELDAARMELDQALTQAPHSRALHRLLTRTEHQQAQLRELTREAG